MTDPLIPPDVPEPPDRRMAARRTHLVSELRRPPRRRPTRRLTVATAGTLAVVAGATVVELVSVDTPSAFAGWSAVPTTPTSDQTSAARAACVAHADALRTGGPMGLAPGAPSTAAAAPGPPALFGDGTTGTTGATGATGASGDGGATGATGVTGSSDALPPPTLAAGGLGSGSVSGTVTARVRAGGPGGSGGPSSTAAFADLQPVLTDARGPYTLVVFASKTAAALCVSGPDLISLDGSGDGAQFGFQSQTGMGSSSVGITAMNASGIHDASVSARIDASNQDSFSVAHGRLDPDVSAVTLDLADGTQVTASTGSGWFVAWWPGTAKVARVELTTPGGVTTQPVATV